MISRFAGSDVIAVNSGLQLTNLHTACYWTAQTVAIKTNTLLFMSSSGSIIHNLAAKKHILSVNKRPQEFCCSLKIKTGDRLIETGD
jgi:hypothetical protein